MGDIPGSGGNITKLDKTKWQAFGVTRTYCKSDGKNLRMGSEAVGGA